MEAFETSSQVVWLYFINSNLGASQSG